LVYGKIEKDTEGSCAQACDAKKTAKYMRIVRLRGRGLGGSKNPG